MYKYTVRADAIAQRVIGKAFQLFSVATFVCLQVMKWFIPIFMHHHVAGNRAGWYTGIIKYTDVFSKEMCKWRLYQHINMHLSLFKSSLLSFCLQIHWKGADELFLLIPCSHSASATLSSHMMMIQNPFQEKKLWSVKFHPLKKNKSLKFWLHESQNFWR